MENNKNELDELVMMDKPSSNAEDGEEVLCHCNCEFTREGFTQQNLLMGIKTFIGLFVLVALAVGFGIYELVTGRLLWGLFFTIFGALYPAIYFLFLKLSIEKNFKMFESTLKGSIYSFEFRTKTIGVTFKSNDGNVRGSVIRYSQIYRVVENKNFFFIFVDATHSYIVEKAKFLETDGIEKVRQILKDYKVKFDQHKVK